MRFTIDVSSDDAQATAGAMSAMFKEAEKNPTETRSSSSKGSSPRSPIPADEPGSSIGVSSGEQVSSTRRTETGKGRR